MANTLSRLQAVQEVKNQMRKYPLFKEELRDKAKWLKGVRTMTYWEKYEALEQKLLILTNCIHNQHLSCCFSDKRRDQFLKWMFDYFKKQIEWLGIPAADHKVSFSATWADVVNNKW